LTVGIPRELQELSLSKFSKPMGIPHSNISAIECSRINHGVWRAKVFDYDLNCHSAVLVFHVFEIPLKALV
jgi:hypothetical protein